MEKKKVLICGAGSIGVYVGVKLHKKKHNVKLFGRRKLSHVGDEVIINNKKFLVPEKIFKMPKNEKHDFVFITTKLYDLDYMVNLIKKNNIQSPMLIGIQNGLVDTKKYSKVLNKRIIPIVVFSGFNLKGNSLRVTPTHVGWKTEYTKQGKLISRFLLDAGIPCTADKNFDSLRAEKTIVNCCLNGLSAIENKPFCDLFENEKSRERIDKLFQECYEILAKEYKLDNKEEIKKRMFKQWSKLKHYSSTCQDIHSGRKHEIKYFNGYIAELGKKHNLPIENNQEILKDIREIVKK